MCRPVLTVNTPYKLIRSSASSSRVLSVSPSLTPLWHCEKKPVIIISEQMCQPVLIVKALVKLVQSSSPPSARVLSAPPSLAHESVTQNNKPILTVIIPLVHRNLWWNWSNRQHQHHYVTSFRHHHQCLLKLLNKRLIGVTIQTEQMCWLACLVRPSASVTVS